MKNQSDYQSDKENLNTNNFLGMKIPRIGKIDAPDKYSGILYIN